MLQIQLLLTNASVPNTDSDYQPKLIIHKLVSQEIAGDEGAAAAPLAVAGGQEGALLAVPLLAGALPPPLLLPLRRRPQGTPWQPSTSAAAPPLQCRRRRRRQWDRAAGSRGGARGGGGGEEDDEVAGAAAVRGERRRRGRGVRRVLGDVGTRRGGAAAAVPGGGLPLHPGAADLRGARAAGDGVPAVAVAAARLHPPGVRRGEDAREAAREACHVRRRLAGPWPVHVAGVPPPRRRPRPGRPVVRHVPRPAAFGVHRRGVQRHGGVLLGAVPPPVQRRQRRRPPHLRPHGPPRQHRAPRPPLGGRRRHRLQHLPLVVHRPPVPDPGGRAVRRRRQRVVVDVGVDRGGVRNGVPGDAAVGEGAHGFQHLPRLLHQHVADARQEPGLGRRAGGELLRRDGDDRRRRVLGLRQPAGRDAGDPRRARRRRRRRAGHLPQRDPAVAVPQGRAHVGVQEAVDAADAGAARRPEELRRLRALVPPRATGHVERAPLYQALLPLKRSRSF